MMDQAEIIFILMSGMNVLLRQSSVSSAFQKSVLTMLNASMFFCHFGSQRRSRFCLKSWKILSLM